MTGSSIYVAIVCFVTETCTEKHRSQPHKQGGVSNEQGRGSVRVRVRNIARAVFAFSHFDCTLQVRLL